MKQLTNKQRAKIYRQAAEMVFENAGNVDGDGAFSCHAIDSILRQEIGTTKWMDLKELSILRPDKLPFSFFGNPQFWHYSEYQERTLGLLLAEQIALNP